MKLTGKLKEKVEKAETKEQAKELIANAGMELTDEEMNMVSGGVDAEKMLIVTEMVHKNPLIPAGDGLIKEVTDEHAFCSDERIKEERSYGNPAGGGTLFRNY